jgi:hypothetical protein
MIRRASDEIARTRYDTIVELRGDERTLLLPFWTGARRRVDRGTVRLRNKAWRALGRARVLHEVETNLETVRPLVDASATRARVEVDPGPEAAASLARKFDGYSLSEARLVVLHAGAAWRPRAWRPERFGGGCRLEFSATMMPRSCSSAPRTSGCRGRGSPLDAGGQGSGDDRRLDARGIDGRCSVDRPSSSGTTAAPPTWRPPAASRPSCSSDLRTRAGSVRGRSAPRCCTTRSRAFRVAPDRVRDGRGSLREPKRSRRRDRESARRAGTARAPPGRGAGADHVPPWHRQLLQIGVFFLDAFLIFAAVVRRVLAPLHALHLRGAARWCLRSSATSGSGAVLTPFGLLILRSFRLYRSARTARLSQELWTLVQGVAILAAVAGARVLLVPRERLRARCS